MKIAISVPDPVFEAAERMSRRMRVSRSRLYAKAVEDYVNRHSGEEITAQLDRVYSRTSSKLDPAIERGTLEVLRREGR
ncbi:MAG: ChpI protein [Acidobacteriota bacterium]